MIFAAAAYAQGGATVTGSYGSYGYGCGTYSGPYGTGTYSGVYRNCGGGSGGSGGNTTPTTGGTTTPTTGGTTTPTTGGTTTPTTGGTDVKLQSGATIPATGGVVTAAGNTVTASFPAGVVKDATSVQATVSTISDDATVKPMVDSALSAFTKNPGAPVDVKVAADVVNLSVTADGKVVDQFAAPVPVTVALKSGIDADMVQVFLQTASGELVPVRTKKAADGSVVFSATGSGKYVVVEARKNFNDMATHWAAHEVASMAAHMVADGYPDGGFRPDGNVTRAEFVSLLARAMGLKPADTAATFADVPAESWYAKTLKAAVDAGLVNGTDAQHFTPDATITREQMMVLIGRAVKMAGLESKPAGIEVFSDFQSVNGWAQSDIGLAFQAGLIKGTAGDGGAFFLNPQATSTRAESATMLFRLFNKM